jgi:hypothetical protein
MISTVIQKKGFYPFISWENGCSVKNCRTYKKATHSCQLQHKLWKRKTHNDKLQHQLRGNVMFKMRIEKEIFRKVL